MKRRVAKKIRAAWYGRRPPTAKTRKPPTPRRVWRGRTVNRALAALPPREALAWRVDLCRHLADVLAEWGDVEAAALWMERWAQAKFDLAGPMERLDMVAAAVAAFASHLAASPTLSATTWAVQTCIVSNPAIHSEP